MVGPGVTLSSSATFRQVAARGSVRLQEAVLGRFATAVPLLGKKVAAAPAWQRPAASFFEIWPKLRTCIPKYQEFVKSCDAKDLKDAHVFMNEGASKELVEYYLCCALMLQREAVEKAASDSQALLALAEKVAREHVEPVIQDAQRLALEYREDVHRNLEELTVWREVDESLYWHHSLKTLLPQQYDDYCKATTQGLAATLAERQGQLLRAHHKQDQQVTTETRSSSGTVAPGEEVEGDRAPACGPAGGGAFRTVDEKASHGMKIKACSSSAEIRGTDEEEAGALALPTAEQVASELEASSEARALALALYTGWIDLAGMPVRGAIRNCLVDHSLLHGVPRAWDGAGLVPQMKHAGEFSRNRKRVREHDFSSDSGREPET
ncbi:unnamed protein product [Amoebophrya sp. A120]|nr:unnamed protein product [Amoebophrya sp. A120]|eukprot:GSA120T00015158001.1